MFEKDIFKKGDKVVFVGNPKTSPYNPLRGTRGTVCMTQGDGVPGVKWDKPAQNGSKMTFVLDREIEKYVEPEKVVIWRDPHDMLRVVAKDMLTGETAEARCHPEEQDEFNFELGAHIALGRLFGHEPGIVEIEIEEAKRPLYNGRVVCVVTGGARYWTEGKIYEIRNGVIHDDDGDEREPVHSVQELNDLMREAVDTLDEMTAFLEIKE